MKQGVRNNSFEKRHSRSGSKSGNNNGINNNNNNNNTNNNGFNKKNQNGNVGVSANGSGVNSSNVVTSQLNLIDDDELQAHFKDRLLYLIINSIGSFVHILTNSGNSINGILQNIDPNSLKIIIKKDIKNNNSNNNDDDSIITLNYEDLIEFELENIDLFNNSYISKKQIGSFKTDQDIGLKKKNDFTPRQDIEKWVPDSNLNISLDQLTLDDEVDSSNNNNSNNNNNLKNWDQFQTNEEKFGIKSEFDEHLYTTKINKNDPNYLKNLEKATKLAKEIESQSFNGNIHLAEERGLKFDDSGLDEEDKYSGVDRSNLNSSSIQIDAKGDALFQSLINKDSKNFQFGDDLNNKNINNEVKTKYIPPSQRSRIQNIDPSIISASKNHNNNDSNNNNNNKLSGESIIKGKENNNNNKIRTKSPPVANSQSPSKQSTSISSNSQQQQQQQHPITSSKQIEKSDSSKNHIDLYKNEKKSSPDHLKKLNTINEINALKEFSQTFKIPSKFPQDLLPILAKDKSKQDEIIKKLESPKNKEASITTTKTKDSTSSSAISSPKPTTSKPTTSTGKKFGDPAKVPTFKLNPKAASFTPFTPSSATTPSTNSNVSTPIFAKNSPRNSPRLTNQSTSYNNGNGPQRSKRYNITPASFFKPDKVPNNDKPRKSISNDFNFFKGCLKEFENKKASIDESESKKWNFSLEKPFVTPPTWTRDEVEKSYKSIFPTIDQMKFQRILPNSIQPNPSTPLQTFQPIPMIHQQQHGPQYFYPPPQPQFIPQHQNFIQLSPQHQNPNLISPSNSPFQQQRSIYNNGVNPNHYPYQSNRYGVTPPIPPPTGTLQPGSLPPPPTGPPGSAYPTNYPPPPLPQGPPGSSGIPTPIIPVGQINPNLSPINQIPPSSGSGHHHNHHHHQNNNNNQHQQHHPRSQRGGYKNY